jgi:ABC-2 type transport system ATP-binding protein
MTAVIQTDRLSKRYGASRGIEDITLTVRRGEVFGFLGPNGAGKTTTIRTLLDLLHPTGGSARVLGLDSRRDSRAIRARTGNLPGDFAFDDRLCGRELVEFFAAVRGRSDLGLVDTFAARFKADLSRPLHELSRGNRQKVGLIQALFHEPELLILDEPTTGLDPLMQEEFLRVVGEQRDRGRTVFLSSHDLDEVERICDRVGIVRDGRLIAVEDVAAMRERAVRHVTVRFGTPAAETLAGVPGVADVVRDGTTLRFRLHGEIDPVIKALARHRVEELEITRPTLEELFLAYYGRTS